MRPPRVFSIPAGECFVDRLVEGLEARHGAAPLDLASTEILVPTRRAVRSLRDAFLRSSGGRPMLLPDLRPIGDVDEEGLVLEGIPEALDVPAAIDPLRRQLLLARLVRAERAKIGMPIDMPQAIALAGDLARLLDRIETERADTAKLARLAPAEFAEHWQLTVEFLSIVTEHWPRILADEGALDPTARRDRLIAARGESYRATTPAHAVIAAGSTGSIPATAELLSVVARLPKGAVVLPGLDRRMSEAAWQGLEASHPQAGLRKLLSVIGIDRAAVEPWVDGLDAPRARGMAIAAALDPAAEADFALQRATAEAALGDMTVIDAPGAREEADAVALLLREALETPGKTASLITPDRALARRVAGALRRWGVAVDDSAGGSLLLSPPAAFMRLTAEAAAEPDDPIALLAMLKHPLARVGASVGEHKEHVRALDLALRGPRRKNPLGALDPEGQAGAWVARIRIVLETFGAALAEDGADFRSLLRAHVAAAEALAEDAEAKGAVRLWSGDDGEALAEFVAELDRSAAAAGVVDGRSYGASFEALLGARVTRRRYGAHPRLAIWGLLEARLQRADLLILGGLSEDIWPAKIEADPWMSRAMAKTLGLEPPERRTGLSAHDFVQAASAPGVVVTRAARVDGAPTVASRWLKRLEAAAPLAMAAARVRGDIVLAKSRALDRPATIRPAQRPEPRPKLALRPRALSVTEIETWMRDPYAIYARHVLGLKALDPIDADPGAAERGTFIHAALAEFVATKPGGIDDGAHARLIAAGRRAFAEIEDKSGLYAFWWPRFERIATWFLNNERARLGEFLPVAAEVSGKLALGDFELRGRADRIDRGRDGRLAIIDYKTGRVPKPNDVALGYSPQLALEGAMAEAGAFAGVAAARVATLEHWRLGGRQAGEIKILENGPSLIEPALDGLRRLIAAFASEATPYRAAPHPGFAPKFSDFAHLERIDEWSGPQADP